MFASENNPDQFWWTSLLLTRWEPSYAFSMDWTAAKLQQGAGRTVIESLVEFKLGSAQKFRNIWFFKQIVSELSFMIIFQEFYLFSNCKINRI